MVGGGFETGSSMSLVQLHNQETILPLLELLGTMCKCEWYKGFECWVLGFLVSVFTPCYGCHNSFCSGSPCGNHVLGGVVVVYWHWGVDPIAIVWKDWLLSYSVNVGPLLACFYTFYVQKSYHLRVVPKTVCFLQWLESDTLCFAIPTMPNARPGE